MKKTVYLSLLLSLLAVLHENNLYAQGPPPGVGSGSNPTGQSGPTVSNVGITFDTTPIYYYYPQDGSTLIPFSDSLLTEVHQYDPTRRGQQTTVHLGNLGAPAYSIWFQPSSTIGWSVGMNVYTPYWMDPMRQKFYALQQAYTQFYYSQGSTVLDGQVEAAFSRNFGKNLNIAVDYKRINNQGLFAYQRTRNTGLQAGAVYTSDNQRYRGVFSMTNNLATHQENGGVSAFPTTGFASPVRLPFSLTGRVAFTRHDQRALQYRHQYQLLGKRDTNDSLTTTPHNHQGLLIEHAFTRTKSQYLFYDAAANDQADYYGDYLTDLRGIRYRIQETTWQNDVHIRWQGATTTLKDGDANTAAFQAGLTHRYHQLAMEPRDSQFQEILLTAKASLPIAQRFIVGGDAWLGLVGNPGTFGLRGFTKVDVGDCGQVQLSIDSRRNVPTLVQNDWRITSKTIYANQFNPTFSTTLQGTLTIPKYKLSLSAANTVLNQWIYTDTLGLPIQANGSASIPQLMVQHTLSWGWLQWNNQFYYQRVPNSIPVPAWFSNHGLHAEGKLFKDVLLLRFGIDVRLIPAWDGVQYLPQLGQYVNPKSSSAQPITPIVDSFLSIRRKRTRMFIKIENMMSLFFVNYYEHVDSYPLPYFTSNIRWGVSWRFVD